MRQTHTFATLELTPAAYDEIRTKLTAAEYQHTFMDDGAIDMHGIGVTRGPEAPPQPAPDSERIDWLEEMFRNCPGTSLMFNSVEDIEVAESIGDKIEPGFVIVTDGCNPVEVNSDISLRDAIDLARHTFEHRDELDA